MELIEIMQEVFKLVNKEFKENRFSIVQHEKDDMVGIVKDAKKPETVMNVSFGMVLRILNERNGSVEETVQIIKTNVLEMFQRFESKESGVTLGNLEKVYPMIKPSGYGDGVNKHGVDDELLKFTSPFHELDVCLVVDIGNSYAYVTKNQLENLGITREYLYEKALQNLKNLNSDNAPQEIELDGGQFIYAPSIQDDLGATRILLVDFEEWVEKASSDVIVSIPNEYTYLIANVEDVELLGFVNMTLGIYMDTEHHQLNPVIHRFKKDGSIDLMMPFLGGMMAEDKPLN